MHTLFQRLLLLLVLIAPAAAAQRPDLPFQSGEAYDLNLMFKIGAVNTAVGVLHVQIDEERLAGEPVYHAQFSARTNKFFDVFYKFREHMHSWIGVQDLHARKFVKEALSGDNATANEYIYDWPGKKIHAVITHEGKAPQKMDFPLDGHVHDIPDLFYYVRTIDPARLRVGEKIHIGLAVDEAVHEVILTYRGPAQLKVRKMGEMSAHRFSVSMPNGVLFEGDKEVQLWMEDGGSRRILAIMAPLRVGSMWGWLAPEA